MIFQVWIAWWKSLPVQTFFPGSPGMDKCAKQEVQLAQAESYQKTPEKQEGPPQPPWLLPPHCDFA